MSTRSLEQGISKLSELGAAKVDHIVGDLAAHLEGTYQLLRLWGNSEPICLAGLYHAVYGTDDFPHMLIGLESREQVRELIGEMAERLVYIYGACDRSFTYRQIIRESGPQYRDRFTGRTFALDHSLLSSLCELTLANELEIASRDKAHLEKYRKQYLTLFGSFEGRVSDRGIRAPS
ncbi:MAG TPA: hypothetical protein VF329_06515 [Gammaproteobacteria bacterium]